jgi:capsular polysaccharide biosynthesis protein/tetratricopeptide (TPR) repeat protein
MPEPELQLVPESAAEDWRAHEWHQEIKDFSLPEKTLLSLKKAVVTRSEYLGPERARGGVYSSQGDYIPSSRHLRRSKDLTADNPAAVPVVGMDLIPGRYLYLGWFFNHYGHFILESLSRCWGLVEAGKIDGIVMHLHAPDRVAAPYLMGFFELLSIVPEKVVFAQQDMQFEQLLLPSQQGVLSRGISADMLALYRQLGLRASNLKTVSAVAEKLYISRRLLPDNQRKASNEKALEDCFQAQGYKVVHPQFMDVISQLALFYGAKKLAGLEGSGLHNLLFARQPEQVWMLAARDSLADAVTQVYLNNACGCSTELRLQGLSVSSSCLHQRITPILLTIADKSGHCPGNISPTGFERFLWLSAFAAQLKRKDCDIQSDDSLVSGLSKGELAAIRYLMNDTAGLPSNTADGMSAFLRAEKEFSLGHHAIAAKLMESQLAGNRNSPVFLARLAEMLIAAKRPADALSMAKKALQIDADNPGLFLKWLELLDKQQLMQDAMPRLRQLAATYTRYFPLQIKLAQLLADSHQFADAAQVLQQVVAGSARHAWLNARLTWYWFRAGEYQLAKQAAHQALRYQSDNPFSEMHLARIHLALHEPEEAQRWIELALERTPEKADLLQLKKKIMDVLSLHTPDQNI